MEEVYDWAVRLVASDNTAEGGEAPSGAERSKGCDAARGGAGEERDDAVGTTKARSLERQEKSSRSPETSETRNVPL